jgi:hypothetical protein
MRCNFRLNRYEMRCNEYGNTKNGCAQDVLSHEYGHYASSTYGGFGELCAAGVDEGDSLDEAVANGFAAIVSRDNYLTKTLYGSFQGFAAFNGSVHVPPAVNAAAAVCGDRAVDGLPFVEAFWELSFNRNCLIGTCTNTSKFNTSSVANIWTGLSEDTVLTRLSRALVWSIDVNPYNGTTFTMLRAQMRGRISADASTAVANAAQRVFPHHGLTCPACCAGC